MGDVDTFAQTLYVTIADGRVYSLLDLEQLILGDISTDMPASILLTNTILVMQIAPTPTQEEGISYIPSYAQPDSESFQFCLQQLGVSEKPHWVMTVRTQVRPFIGRLESAQRFLPAWKVCFGFADAT